MPGRSQDGVAAGGWCYVINQTLENLGEVELSIPFFFASAAALGTEIDVIVFQVKMKFLCLHGHGTNSKVRTQ